MFRIRLLLVCALAASGAFGIAGGQLRAGPHEVGPTAEDGYFETIEPVAESVWLVRQAKPFHLQPIGNVTVIEQDGGIVLVDSGGSPGSARRIAALVKTVSSKPVTHIILTHWHGDHTLGLGGMLESWPEARIVASEPTRQALLGSSMERYPKGAPDPARTAAFVEELAGAGAFFETALARPDLSPGDRAGFERTRRELAAYSRDADGLYLPANILAHGGELTLSDPVTPVRMIQLGRANTDGDTVVWLPRQKIMVSGDIIAAPVPFGFDSYPGEWIDTLKRIRSYPFSALIPGHGEVQRDRAYIDRLVALIEEVRRQVRPLAERGLSLQETREQVDFAEQRRQFAGSDPWLARWFDRYWVEPFVESAWKEAKGEPIEQGKG